MVNTIAVPTSDGESTDAALIALMIESLSDCIMEAQKCQIRSLLHNNVDLFYMYDCGRIRLHYREVKSRDPTRPTFVT